jgi:hypothetical protein
MPYSPYFADEFEPQRSDDDDLADRIEHDAQQKRDAAWADAENLHLLRPLEDRPPADFQFSAE